MNHPIADPAYLGSDRKSIEYPRDPDRWNDEGHRTYEALDPEGHRWRFHQRIRS